MSRPIPLNMPSPNIYKQFETRRPQRTKAHLLTQPTPPAVLKLLRGRTTSLSYLLRGMRYLGRMPVRFRSSLTGVVTAKSPITPRQAVISSLGRICVGSIGIIRTTRGPKIETNGAISQAKAMRKRSIGTKGPEMNAAQMRTGPPSVLKLSPRCIARPSVRHARNTLPWPKNILSSIQSSLKAMRPRLEELEVTGPQSMLARYG